jgi:hypothetical protein
LFFVIFFLCLICDIHAQERCEHHFYRIEKEKNIPEHTLKAIAFTESGQRIAKNRMIAWPWTINVKGRGYIFKTKQKAIVAARFLLQLGFNNFDVGCMQINLKHHPQAFEKIEDAFDPALNVRYAATFLERLNNENKNWVTSIAHYHNIQEKYNIPYQRKVLSYQQKLAQNLLQDIDGIENLTNLETAFYESDQTFFYNSKQDVGDGYIGTPIPKSVTPVAVTESSKIIPIVQKTTVSPVLNRFGVTAPTQNQRKYTLPKGLSVSYTPKAYYHAPVNRMHVTTSRFVGNVRQSQQHADHKMQVNDRE